jgi:cleavage and polyadenylation specificity factor subunit 3
MDHAASLPYVLAKTNFAGRVYMTHPTKAIYKWLMQDSVRVQNTHAAASGANDGGGVDQLFNEHDILSTLPQIQTISFNTTHTHNGIRITPYPAGHVLGACMYLIEIAGLNTLFTGDYSRENDRHLIPATIPKGLKVDCLITESTFGISTHIPRAERETALMKSITGILNRGGRALLPVFAIGMAQELLLILEEYWQKHPDYRRYPIYFASALARKCMVVYQTYIDSMNDNIRSKLHNRLGGDSNGEKGGGGPWDFQFIRSLKSLDRFDDVGGCVMLASPGMLQNGVSRTLLERWAPEGKNGVVITGYSVEGTMAKEIMKEPDSIPAVMTQRGGGGGPMMGKKASGPGGEDRPMIPRRCTVQEFSFAAHVDGAENRAFIEEVNAPVVVLVHGERGNMMRMRSRLLGLGKFKVYSPANCEEVRIPFRREKVAKVVGRLANEINPQAIAGLLSPPSSGEDSDDADGESKDVKRRKDESQVISGVLVQNEFKLSLMAPEDLREYAGLNTTTITCRQRITLGAAGIDLIKWSLEGTFGSVDVSTTTSKDSKANGNGASNSTTSSTSTTPKPEPADAEMSNTDYTAALPQSSA